MFKNVLRTLAVVAGLFFLTSTQVSAASYTVEENDTLWKISQETNVPLYEIRYVNNQWNDIIFPGQELKLPEYLNKAEKDLLARLVRAEAEGEPYEGKVAVATVVLNRVAHEDFPDTIEGVIYQKRQFTPVDNGTINEPADAESIKAVEEAVLFQGQGSGSLFFYNPEIATSHWIATREYVTTIGDHVFAK